LLAVFVLPAIGQEQSASSDVHLNVVWLKPWIATPQGHGYWHGYEDGFHSGDLDLQLQRLKTPLERVKLFQEARRGYEEAFGDKKLFEEGYRRGYVAGYDDAASNRRFYALERLQAGQLKEVDAMAMARDARENAKGKENEASAPAEVINASAKSAPSAETQA